MNRRLRIFCEGHGDSKAVPILVNRTLELKQAKDALWLGETPPMRIGNVVKLLNNDAAEWERLVRAAAQQGRFGLLAVLRWTSRH